MDGITGAAASGAVSDVGRILEMVTAANIDLAKKMLQVTVETALQGSEAGKGGAIDVSG